MSVTRDNQTRYIDSVLKALQIRKPLGPDDLPDSVRARARMFYDPAHNRHAAYLYPAAGQWSSETIRDMESDLAGRGPEWHLTGWVLLQDDLKKSIIRESVTAALLSLCFILVVLYLHFRRPAVIVLVALPLFFGLLLTLGIMCLTNTGFNYIKISALAMIFGISVDYGVYFMQTSLESGNARDSALTSHAFKNIVVCSLTTMAGFGSLMTTGFRGVASLGLVLMIGISCCLLMSACLVPLSRSFRGGDR
jgi:predicted RND superfamily exporter protein